MLLRTEVRAPSAALVTDRKNRTRGKGRRDFEAYGMLPLRVSVLLDALEKPSLGIGPIALDGAFRNPENLRRFAFAESDKKPELDYLGFGGVGFFQLRERLVHGENRFLLDGRSHFHLLNVQPL